MTTATQMTELLRLAKKGQRAEKRGAAWGRFITRLLVITLVNFVGAFWLMLAVGIMHNDWWPGLPPMGYWTAFLIVVLLRGVFSHVPPSKDKGEA